MEQARRPHGRCGPEADRRRPQQILSPAGNILQLSVHFVHGGEPAPACSCPALGPRGQILETEGGFSPRVATGRRRPALLCTAKAGYCRRKDGSEHAKDAYRMQFGIISPVGWTGAAAGGTTGRRAKENPGCRLLVEPRKGETLGAALFWSKASRPPMPYRINLVAEKTGPKLCIIADILVPHF